MKLFLSQEWLNNNIPLSFASRAKPIHIFSCTKFDIYFQLNGKRRLALLLHSIQPQLSLQRVWYDLYRLAYVERVLQVKILAYALHDIIVMKVI